MAEQFAGDQVPGNRAAVDGDIGTVFTVALIVNRLGENVLARAALSQEQNVGAAPGNHSGLIHRHQEAGIPAVNIFKMKIGGSAHHFGDHRLGPLNFVEDDDLPDNAFVGGPNRVAGQGKVAGNFFEKIRTSASVTVSVFSINLNICLFSGLKTSWIRRPSTTRAPRPNIFRALSLISVI